jgi:hypothetical protein
MPAETNRGRWRSGRVAVASGAIAGVVAWCARAWLWTPFGWDEPWVIAEWLIYAACAGALLANAVWLGAAPRRRVTPLAALLGGLFVAT